MMAVPNPKIGANKLLPMQTCCPEHGQYDLKVDLSGITWPVALVSANKETRLRVVGICKHYDGIRRRFV
jgi:hypothetical protein